jgi:hypothetical protein
VPDPITLNDFGGGLEANFRGFDRAGVWGAYWTTNHLYLEIVETELGQVAVAILEVAIRAVDATRGERPVVASVRWAIEGFVTFDNIDIQRTIGRGGENIILAILAPRRSPIIYSRIKRVVIIGIHVERLADLALIAHAADGEGLLPGTGKRRQQHCGKNCDDGNYHEQLN